MTLVVDASVAVKWFIDEVGSDDARALLTSAERLVAPDLVLAEIGNVVWREARRGVADVGQIRLSVVRARQFFDALVPLVDLVERGLEIAAAVDHALYDCLYLAAVERTSGRLVTADERFVGKLQATSWGPAVGLLGSPA